MQLYNSRTRKLETINPIDGVRIRIYTCGPTVYNFAHIGNFRAYIAADTLKRALIWRGFSVEHTMNITDVDDKMILNSHNTFPDKNPMQALLEFGEIYTTAFWEDFKALKLLPPDHITKAIDYIPHMQSLIKTIITNGYAYEKGGSIYFDVQKYAQNFHYGELVNIDIHKLKTDARIDSDEYDKENAQDFALWKAQKDNEPCWQFQYKDKQLPGRPGWHIECSAMAQDTLGVPFDIHTGGVDLKFPHHEDEIAQSVIGYGVDTPVAIWMHNEHLMIEGEKMAKSKNNFYTFRDIVNKGYSPQAIRYVLLATHYRQPLNFTFDGLTAAQEAIHRIEEVIYQSDHALIREEQATETEQLLGFAKTQITEALDDDLNISQTFGVLFDTIKKINTQKLYGQPVIEWLDDLNAILGILRIRSTANQSKTLARTAHASQPIIKIKTIDTDSELQFLLAQRKQARDEKNFELADTLRAQIEAQFSVELRDTPQDQQIKPKT